MESSHFNLRQSVDNYISLIQSHGALTGSDVKELTDHLLDASEDLVKGGLSQEEAFLIASKRLGNEDVLTQEYAKVNTSVNTNKIWAYLFIGFNILYTIPSFIKLIFGGLYMFMNEHFGSGWLSVLIITSAHLLFTCLIIVLVSKKNAISGFIEGQVRRNSLRIVLLSFIPYLVLFLMVPIFISKFQLIPGEYLIYPMHKFKGTLVEFTFYLAALSIVGAVLALVFSIEKPDRISLKSLFEKPSPLFLIFFGALVETLAASSRTLPTIDILLHSLIFGMIYVAASFLISLHNGSSAAQRYLLVFALFGFIAEFSLGINKAVENGYFYNNIYYCTALLTGVFVGWRLGSMRRNARLITL